MKSSFSAGLAVTVALATASAGAGVNRVESQQSTVVINQPVLKVIGPVEAYDAAHRSARILGQTVILPTDADLAIGDIASVLGTTRSDGAIVAAVVEDHGLYIPGSSIIFLSGTIEKVNPAVGRVTVNGITVDYTALLADESTAPAAGRTVETSGTQPVLGGIVLATTIAGASKPNSVNGSGLSALRSVNGSGASAIHSVNGSGLSALRSVNGSGLSAVYSVNGSGFSALRSVNGSGANAVQSVNGSGLSALRSVNGSGASAVQSVNGSGLSALRSVNGSGASAVQSVNGSGASALRSVNGSGLSALRSVNGSG
jgi:hypothetical protein